MSRYRSSYRRRSSSDWALWAPIVLLFGGAILFFVLITLALGALVHPSASTRLLVNEGFTNVRLQEKHIWFVQLRGCSDEDSARFDYTAINPRGQNVRIQVCDGVIKGATVRG
jgi:hypothetical protein